MVSRPRFFSWLIVGLLVLIGLIVLIPLLHLLLWLGFIGLIGYGVWRVSRHTLSSPSQRDDDWRDF